jgi:two-component system, chemotaxis family, sensor kinase Cph1
MQHLPYFKTGSQRHRMNALNRTDAEFCGKVPLHQTNLIQPHGYLLVIDKSDFTILQVSENVEDLLGKPANDVINTSLETYITDSDLKDVKNRFNYSGGEGIPFVFSFHSGERLAVIKFQESYFILEVDLEIRSLKKATSFIPIYQELKFVMAAIERADSINKACSIAIKELKRVSGFDKIMVYSFDEDWNGDVIAEVMEAGMDSYLGLKFPASDVPQQARALYLKMPYRLIPNIDYVPVKLYPVINPAVNGFTDLSDSNLRSVAGVHLEYLSNMKVKASMSTRIMENGKLWGLIACHNREPFYLSFEFCALFELVSNVLSAKLQSLNAQDSFKYKSGMQAKQLEIVEDVYKEADIFKALKKNEKNILSVLGAEGVSIILNRNQISYGRVPSQEEVNELVYWLQSKKVDKTYHQQGLSFEFEPALAYSDKASGLLVLPIQAEKGNYILAFRPEEKRKVNWGGNPNEAINFEPGGKKYHPRASFNIWQQNVDKKALPWQEQELEVAETFRNFVMDYALNKM